MWIDALLMVAAVGFAVPCVIVLMECLGAALGGRRADRVPVAAKDDAHPRCAVIVPAHDEAGGIRACISCLREGVHDGDRIVVVADNCSDATANEARAGGADVVLERNEPDRRGKGYALAFAVESLRSDPPEVVVFMDADCVPATAAISRIVSLASSAGRPVQAAYRILPPEGASPSSRVSGFAVELKNVVRPTGLARFAMPCLLTGSGMAFPWDTLQRVNLASGHIVEDMQLTVDLARAGHPPRFCGDAEFTSRLPIDQGAALEQRRRWEHGHLLTLRRAALLWLAAIRGVNLPLAVLGLELAVPSLTLLGLAGLLVGCATIGSAMSGRDATPSIVWACGFGAILMGVFIAWIRFGREYVSPRDLLSVGSYMIRKLPIYFSFMLGKRSEWVRTRRDEAVGSDHDRQSAERHGPPDESE